LDYIYRPRRSQKGRGVWGILYKDYIYDFHKEVIKGNIYRPRRSQKGRGRRGTVGSLLRTKVSFPTVCIRGHDAQVNP